MTPITNNSYDGGGSNYFCEEIRFSDIIRGDLLGKGSFGTVFRAFWHSSEGRREVAIKYFESDLEKAEFHVERRQLARVRHPNIIALYGVCTDPCILLIMEFAECGSLYKVLHQMKPAPVYNAGHAISWSAQCARGVAYLHALKPMPLIHRDLKSPNLLLVNQGLTLKICDFGTACDKSTVMTNMKGSAAWMAPEVFEGNTYTEKCDVFSWGIILWEMLTRRLPFEEIGGNDLRVLWAIHTDQRPPPIAGCPDPLHNLMAVAWHKDISVRPSMASILEEMVSLLPFFPGSDQPIYFPEPDCDQDTLGSESTFDTAESTSQVNSLVPSDQNPETLALAVHNPQPLALSALAVHNPQNLDPPTLDFNNPQLLDPPASIRDQRSTNNTCGVNISSNPFDPFHQYNNATDRPNHGSKQTKLVNRPTPLEIKINDNNQNKKQGYWTPPEDELEISLPQFDPKALIGAPPELLRARANYRPGEYQGYAGDFFDESSSMGVPSDILVEREDRSVDFGPEYLSTALHNLNITDRGMNGYLGGPIMRSTSGSKLSPIQQSPLLQETNPFIFNQHYRGPDSSLPVPSGCSDVGSQGSRSFYAGCGYSRDYFRNLAGESFRRTSGRPPPSPGTPQRSPRPLHSPGTTPRPLTSPGTTPPQGGSPGGRGFLQPSGSPASEASKSPQRSPQARRGAGYNYRSYHNPIGSVYHDPGEEGWGWQQQQDVPPEPAGGWREEGGWARGQYPEEDRVWAARNHLPYETLANYPGHAWGGPGSGDGYYLSPRTPPIYSSARQNSNMAPLRDYLPAPHYNVYPSSSPAPPPPHISPNSPRRERGAPRPYSADVGRLLSVEEGSEGSEKSQKIKGHKRSSSYGSGSEQLSRPIDHRYDDGSLRHGMSYNNIHRPQSREEYYYGRGDSLLDAACDMLSVDLRPVPPQPNCPQSMKIFEDHRQMAGDFVRVQAELSDLRRYKAQLQEKLNQEENETLTAEKAREYTQLKSEKESLLAFREKLSEQLKLIEAAQNYKNNAGSLPSSHGSADDWVLVKDKE